MIEKTNETPAPRAVWTFGQKILQQEQEQEEQEEEEEQQQQCGPLQHNLTEQKEKSPMGEWCNVTKQKYDDFAKDHQIKLYCNSWVN